MSGILYFSHQQLKQVRALGQVVKLGFMKIFIIAGEESGDILGADLMASLQTKYKKHDFIFRGIGGTRMQAQGLSSLFPMQELSLMGIAEILPKVPHLLKRIRQAAESVETFQPDILMTIDSPDFSFRVAKQIKKRNLDVPLKVHYVAPTVWAWRPGRAKKIAALYDAILCLFPFEPPYFKKEGMEAAFIGHPMSKLLEGITPEAFIKKYDLAECAAKVGVLFGSREGEISRMAETFIGAVKQITNEFENPCIICPTLPHLREKVDNIINTYKDDMTCRFLVTSDEGEKYQAMAACDVAVATSGTVGLELAVLGVPHVIGYKVNALTYEIGKRLITTKYAHLGNIILQEEIIPEFIQHDCTAENIAANILGMLEGNMLNSDLDESFRLIRQAIRGPDGASPSDVAADYIMSKFSS